MVCIYCGGDTQVINSRAQKRLNRIWRRRKCLACGAIFSTHEAADYAAAWRIKDAHGKLAAFNRYRLLLSLYKSLEHRKTALNDAEALLDTIISKLQPQIVQGVLEIADVREMALVTLENFDAAAGVSYKAFHP